jgi:CubicO group peptidase (beta-lactamase class C family)
MKLRPGTPEEAGMSAARVRRVSGLARDWVERGEVQSLAVIAARRGVVVLDEAYGPLTAEPDAPPLQSDSIFTLASISKVLTTTALMLLVDNGLVSLNHPVREYIPEFVGEGKDAVTLHHLATHTSGLHDGVANRHAERKQGAVKVPPPYPGAHPEVHEHLYLRYDTPLWKPPGVEMSYCNFGMALLGDIAQRVSGQSIDAFSRERIYTPLGMKDTFYEVPETVRHRVARRPEDHPDAYLDSLEIQEVPWMGGAAFGSAADMAIFAQMFLNGGSYGDKRILSRAAVAAMTRNQIPGISARYGDETFREACWGLGWCVHGDKRFAGSLRSPETYSHGGAGGTFVWVDPVNEIVGVYFAIDRRRSMLDLFMNAVTAAVE